MALEYIALPGNGSKVLADQVDTDKFAQVIKLGLGADGATPTVVAAGQTTKANAVPVVLPSDQDPLPLVRPSKTIIVTPTVSASPDYGIDDVLGGKMTLDGMARASDKTGLLPWAMMTCDVDIPSGVTVDILFFSANPSNSTFTDNGAIAVNVADLHFLCGIIQLDKRIDLGTPAALIPSSQPIIPFTAVSGTDDLYAVAIVRGAATLNLASTSDVNFIFGAVQD